MVLIVHSKVYSVSLSVTKGHKHRTKGLKQRTKPHAPPLQVIGEGAGG